MNNEVKIAKEIWFDVTRGLRGYFAVCYDEDGPIQSGIGSYETPQEAAQEAVEWAMEEGRFGLADKLRNKYNI